MNFNEFHRLISVGSCGLHPIHGAFHASAEATEWSIKKILIGAYYVLHDSPANGSNKFPLNFCGTW